MNLWHLLRITGVVMVAMGFMGRMGVLGASAGTATRTYDTLLLVVGAVLLFWGYWRSRQ
ncbi:hypothetical protein CCP4SC76_5410030 [Gammaproteobacteria bacterium]